MSSSDIARRALSNRITNVAGCVWLLGLVAWYAGGSTAIDRLLDNMALFAPVAVLSLLGGAIALFLEPKLDKGAFGTAVFLAAGLALLGYDLAALINCYADGSGVLEVRASVLSFQAPAKGPRTVRIALDGEHVTFQAAHAATCRDGGQAMVELRSGTFGARWMQTIRCEH